MAGKKIAGKPHETWQVSLKSKMGKLLVSTALTFPESNGKLKNSTGDAKPADMLATTTDQTTFVQ
jgi:hypothetical protein